MKNSKIIPNSFLLKMMMIMTFLGVQETIFAQENSEKAVREARKYMQEAEEALSENDFASAEAYYRQAIAKDPANAAARYNLGNLYYNKEINHEAVERHSQAAEVTPQKEIKHSSFHNQGNAFMKQKKYQEAVEAYKNALRSNPNDDETRYNLALAKKMLEEEQKNGGGGDDNKEQNQDQKNQDQQDDKNKEGDQGEKEQSEDGEPQQNKEGGDQNEQKQKEGEDQKGDKGDPKDDQKQDKQQDQKGENGEKQPQQQQPVPGQLSPQQVKNLLEAMGNEEKKVQDKINAEKAKGAKTTSEKDW